MRTQSDNIQQQSWFGYKAFGAVVAAGMILFAVYIWALFDNRGTLLTVLGLGSVLILLLSPVIMAITSARSAGRWLHSGTTRIPVQQTVASSLRQNFMLAVSAVLIPIVALFNLYLHLTVSAIFQNIVTCMDGPCVSGNNTILPADMLMTPIFALIIALGYWGVNILACALSVALVSRSRQRVSAVVITCLCVVAIDYALLNILFLNPAPLKLPLVIAAAICPYSLTGIVWMLAANRTIATNPAKN